MATSRTTVPDQRTPADRSDTDRPGLRRLAEFVLHHRKWVVVAWLLALFAGGAAAGQLSTRLKIDFSMPGQPGYETAKKLTTIFGANSGFMPPTIAVVTVPAGTTVTADAATIEKAFTTAAAKVPGSRLVDYGNTQDAGLISPDGRTTIALVFTPLPKTFGTDQVTTPMRDALTTSLPAPYKVGITGLDQLAAGGDSKGPGVFAETMFGALGALAVLAFVFASLLALVPMAIAAVSILSTLLVVLALTYLTDVSFIVQFLVALVGLGIAIDYSLLLVTRWREEHDRGADNHTAVVRAVETAGHTVVVSGVTVAIGLLALVVIPVPGLRSVGIGGILIPLVSIAVVLTLLPAILGGIGPRVDWPRIRHEKQASPAWSRWARLIVRRRWVAVGGAAALLTLAVIPIFSMKVGQTAVQALAKSGPARVAYDQMVNSGLPAGALTPIEILTKSDAAAGTVDKLKGVPGISTVALPVGVQAKQPGYADVIALPKAETVNNTTLAPVQGAKKALAHDPGVIGLTGVGPIQQDYAHAVFGQFPLMFALIALATFVLLVRAFRSLLLAVKAVLLNLVSLAATFGLITWFWQQGHGSEALFNIPATGAMTFWIPLMIFAFLFGLSMDYEVFILSRMREEYDATGSTNHAVIEGIGRTGRLVTSAALILFMAFASLASAPNTDIKVLATALGFGILLDATVVRALLVPAMVSLFGRYNWWLPEWLAKPLRVPASPLPPREIVAPRTPVAIGYPGD
ncbi:MAG: putative drug exporter of the superfamily [Actinomycetota bacterium]|nr:putative drug exporter of the superfamily [Actinomycetota bacterium]